MVHFYRNSTIDRSSIATQILMHLIVHFYKLFKQQAGVEFVAQNCRTPHCTLQHKTFALLCLPQALSPSPGKYDAWLSGQFLCEHTPALTADD